MRLPIRRADAGADERAGDVAAGAAAECEPIAAPPSAPSSVPVFSFGPRPDLRIARAGGKQSRSAQHNR